MPSGTSTQVSPLSPSLSQPYLGTPSHSPSLNSEVSDAEVENQRKKKKPVKVIVSFIHQHLLALWAGGAEASRWPDGKVPDECRSKNMPELPTLPAWDSALRSLSDLTACHFTLKALPNSWLCSVSGPPHDPTMSFAQAHPGRAPAAYNLL